MIIAPKRSLLFMCVFVSILMGCSDAAQVVQPSGPRPTKTHLVSSVENYKEVRLPAVIKAARTSQLRFQVAGKINQLDLVEGTLVKKGELLAQLDLREFRNAVSAATADFERAQLAYDRAIALAKKEAISDSIRDQRLAARDMTRAALDNAKKQLSDAILVAPFEAIVADVHVRKFETVSPAQPIVTLQSEKAIQAIVQVPASIVIHPESESPIDMFLVLDAARHKRIPVTFYEFVARGDSATQTFEVSFMLDAQENLNILPGMTGVLSARLNLPASTNTAPIVVPYSAVLSEGENTFVWIVDTANLTVTKRSITIDEPKGKMVAISSGVSAGETIVSAGGDYLYEGAPIRLFEQQD